MLLNVKREYIETTRGANLEYGNPPGSRKKEIGAHTHH
jgi:hypothetical protein